MSSSSKTANLNMHKWARTDPVLCDDFNENFGIIDNAIGGIKSAIGGLGSTYGECQIYTGTYAGNGAQVLKLYFANTPSIIFFQKGIRPALYYGIIFDGTFMSGEEYNISINVNGGEVTFTCATDSYRGINVPDYTYTYVAFGPVKNKT